MQRHDAHPTRPGSLGSLSPRAELRVEDVPAPVLALARVLADAGFETALVGGCVRDLLSGRPVTDFDLTTAASIEVLLTCFPRAIPIGVRHGTVMVPTPAGPVDVTTLRAGPRLEDDLARRDFTLNAIAWRVTDEQLVDPFGGRADLAAARLRAVGDPAARLAEDPLRALRATRLVATLGLSVDPALEAALRDARPSLVRVARERVRHELARLLLAPDAAAGLRLLRSIGIEADLAPGAAADAPEIVPRLPAELALRLAAWLRSPDGAPSERAGGAAARAESILTRLRFPKRLALHVAALVRAHPVDHDVDPRADASLRRLLRRVGEEDVDALLGLREAELEVQAAQRPEAVQVGRANLAALRDGLARLRATGESALQRLDLALDGRAVMEALGCGPGPGVGDALRFLTERVLDDPACNTPDRLRALLQERAAESRGGSGTHTA